MVDHDNVVYRLPSARRPSATEDLEAKTRHWREAVELASLARLTTLAYERERQAAAKKFGCRPNVLDRMIAHIRDALHDWETAVQLGEQFSGRAWPRLRKLPTYQGEPCDWGGSESVLILEAAAEDDGTVQVLVLFADGSGQTDKGELERKTDPWDPRAQ